MEKLGLYGGTFAPPHYGHIHAVKTFLKEVSPDRVLIMPTCQPPHKAKAAGDTPEVRLEMCCAAFGGIPGVQVSDYEIRKADVSYTVQTLEHLSAPNREIYLLCGTDMFLTLDRWYRAEEIFRLAKMVCISRTDEKKEEIREASERYEKRFGQKGIFLEAAPLVLSSSGVREAIRAGEALTDYVPEAVEAIIRRDGLYRGREE
ncbi:MAG: nicotinate (nicotinamide) nucleotide adenylyltransferase [Clostridia bacterium]|nr:nicotinate (nicotinamide) nucleotide adenylyltransferase [Clostridia bacterium]